MECGESARRREDVAPGHWRGHQAGLHRWRPGLSTALQRPVRPDDIVRAAQEIDVPVFGNVGPPCYHVCHDRWPARPVV